jgi:OOP family OmpA-OmpF porin
MPLTPDKEEVIEFQQATVYFDFNKYTEKPEYYEQIARIAQEMLQYLGQKFEIAGYTDERGSDTYNDRLSLRRAQTIRNMLVKNGVSAKDLVVKAYGETKQIVPNAQTEEDHAKNRRVEIKFFNE